MKIVCIQGYTDHEMFHDVTYGTDAWHDYVVLIMTWFCGTDHDTCFMTRLEYDLMALIMT